MTNMPDNNAFADGIRFFRPNDKAPDFVKGNVVIDARAFAAWMKENMNEEGTVRLDLLVSKKGAFYFKLNTFQPKQKAASVPDF